MKHLAVNLRPVPKGAPADRSALSTVRRLGRVLIGFVATALVISTVAPVRAADAQNFYVVKGRRGVVTITNRQPTPGSDFKVFAPRRPAFSRFYGVTRTKWAGRPVDSPFDSLIQDTALENALDPALVKAVVHVESMFNPHARSPKGAMGLMQLMPGTATRFGVDNAYLPEENVAGGVRYLRMLHDRYEGDTRLALAAYNAGEGAVDRMRGVPPYAETQTYVKRVMRMTELYRCATAGRKDC